MDITRVDYNNRLPPFYIEYRVISLIITQYRLDIIIQHETEYENINSLLIIYHISVIIAT